MICKLKTHSLYPSKYHEMHLCAYNNVVNKIYCIYSGSKIGGPITITL